MYHHMRLLKQKGKCVFAKKSKGRPTQKLPGGGDDDELVIVAGPPLRRLWRQDDATVLDIVVIELARHGESRRLLVRLLDEVHSSSSAM
jgi:hypothetical protein